jgi:acyl-homoserine-lactone acylase
MPPFSLPRQRPVLLASALIACAGLLFSARPVHAQPVAKPDRAGVSELQRWQSTARRVTILRDSWGVPHIYGKTDADVVFGMIFAQAEDDFNRVEVNYINALGRMAEVEGETALVSDLRMRLFIDPAALRTGYRQSPPWLRKLMNAWADGLNHYLHTHPEVKPKLLTRFEPWMALSFTEGSIGGDIESIDLKALESFYGKRNGLPAKKTASVAPADALAALTTDAAPDPEPRGSNGFAIAPAISANGHALLLINPHTSFYFRSEAQAVSEEGLNVYGASTWGQFFVYQGFNDRLGWMHTSGGADTIDEYLETVFERGGRWRYRYGADEKLLKATPITLKYKTASGMATAQVTTFHSHHGPIVREQKTDAGQRWVAVQLMQAPVKALQQSYLRTKARSYAEFVKVMDLRTNSSNNTVYADADGNIALFYGNFVPRRNPHFDFTKPVDGSDPATDWKGLHAANEAIQLRNPKNGWLQNTNNWPFSAAGEYSPRQADYPAYMWTAPENARGIHAQRVLKGQTGFTLDKLIAAAYDTQLTAFEPLLPRLFKAYDAASAAGAVSGDSHAALREPIAALRAWDLRYAIDSVPTALAITWYKAVREKLLTEARASGLPTIDYITTQAPEAALLAGLADAVARLERDFGSWKTPWGEINRFQRLTGDISQPFDDSQPSVAIPYASGTFGSLASFGGSAAQKTKRSYGDVGNSFVAAVEFGPRIQARSILVGGQSGNPASKHFSDQVDLYRQGQFKEVWFYRADVEKHLERRYSPGQ